MAKNTNEIVIWYNQILFEEYLKTKKDDEGLLESIGNAALAAGAAIIGYESDDTKDGELGNVWFQDVRVDQRSRMMKVPMEDGTIIWDSKVRDPATITMKIAIKRYANTLANELMHGLLGGSMPETWQDTYLKLKAMYNATVYSNDPNSAAGVNSIVEQKDQDETFFTEMMNHDAKTEVYSNGQWLKKYASAYAVVQTGSQVFKNMMMTGLAAVEDSQHFDYLQYNLEFTQQVIAGAANEILPESAADSSTISLGSVAGLVCTQGVGTLTSVSSFI